MKESNNICWVTGAAGFIGKRMARELASKGRIVLGIGHGTWPSAEWNKWGFDYFLNGDLAASNFHFLKRKAGAPNEIYHLAGGSSVSAALQSPLEDFKRTVCSTAELFEWVRLESPESKLVVSSSSAVYGTGHTNPIKESEQSIPYSVYGYNKSMMENFCSMYSSSFKINTVIARIFSVYGIGLKKQLLWDVCSKLRADSTILHLSGTGEETRDWIHVDDVTMALTKLVDVASPTAPAINIGTGKGTSVRDIAMAVAAQWNTENCSSETKLVFDGNKRTGDPFCLIADVSKFTNVVTLPKTNLISSIADYVDWYKYSSVQG